MLVYLNEKGEKTPPHIVGLRDNYDVADCSGIDEKTDQANGCLITAAPELFKACEAAIDAFAENSPGYAPSETNLKAADLCRAACDKVYESQGGRQLSRR